MSSVQDTKKVEYEPFDPAELVLSADTDGAAEEGKANSNIPRAKFIENVEVFTAKRDPMAILGGLRELLSKYQYMNEQLMSQRRSIKRKLPDIQQAKETVTYLKKQKEEGVGEYRCRFPLTDNAHANAKVNPQEIDSVCLWLGANILLEYKLDEATDLLNENDSSARKSLADLEQGIAVVRDQITTTEVNIARVHNFNVKLRSEKRQPQPAAQES